MIDQTSVSSPQPPQRPPPPARPAGPAGGSRCGRRSSSRTAGWRCILGLALLAVVISGVVLLYEQEIDRVVHPELHHSTKSGGPDHPRRGARRGPPRGAGRSSRPTSSTATACTSSTTTSTRGRPMSIPAPAACIGIDDTTDGVMGFLYNVHLCGLSCKGYAGYLPFLEKPAHILGNDELTVGGLILAVTGLLLLLLAATGLVVWWPGIKRFARGLRLRRRPGTYAFNYDLHNVIGIAALPFLVMWGFTGAHFELKQVSELWYAVLPGHAARGARDRVQAADGPRGDHGPGRGDRAPHGAGRPARVGLGARREGQDLDLLRLPRARQRPLRPRRLPGQRRRRHRPLQRQGDDHATRPRRTRRSPPSSSTTGSIRCTPARSSTAGGGWSG